jgi:hypothetical protein
VTAEPEVAIVVGIFATAPAAEDARAALEGSGFGPDTVTVIAAANVDTRTLAAVTGTPAGEWEVTLAAAGQWLVLVSIEKRRGIVEQILRDHGAQEVLAGDPAVTEPTTGIPMKRAEAAPPAVEVGMTVMSADRREVGRVKKMNEGVMLVARPFRPDVWVPLTAVDRVVQHWVLLTIPFLEVDVAASFLLKRQV